MSDLRDSLIQPSTGPMDTLDPGIRIQAPIVTDRFMGRDYFDEYLTPRGMPYAEKSALYQEYQKKFSQSYQSLSVIAAAADQSNPNIIDLTKVFSSSQKLGRLHTEIFNAVEGPGPSASAIVFGGNVAFQDAVTRAMKGKPSEAEAIRVFNKLAPEIAKTQAELSQFMNDAKERGLADELLVQTFQDIGRDFATAESAVGSIASLGLDIATLWIAPGAGTAAKAAGKAAAASLKGASKFGTAFMKAAVVPQIASRTIGFASNYAQMTGEAVSNMLSLYSMIPEDVRKQTDFTYDKIVSMAKLSGTFQAIAEEAMNKIGLGAASKLVVSRMIKGSVAKAVATGVGSVATNAVEEGLTEIVQGAIQTYINAARSDPDALNLMYSDAKEQARKTYYSAQSSGRLNDPAIKEQINQFAMAAYGKPMIAENGAVDEKVFNQFNAVGLAEYDALNSWAKVSLNAAKIEGFLTTNEVIRNGLKGKEERISWLANNWSTLTESEQMELYSLSNAGAAISTYDAQRALDDFVSGLKGGLNPRGVAITAVATARSVQAERQTQTLETQERQAQEAKDAEVKVQTQEAQAIRQRNQAASADAVIQNAQETRQRVDTAEAKRVMAITPREETDTIAIAQSIRSSTDQVSRTNAINNLVSISAKSTRDGNAQVQSVADTLFGDQETSKSFVESITKAAGNERKVAEVYNQFADKMQKGTFEEVGAKSIDEKLRAMYREGATKSEMTQAVAFAAKQIKAVAGPGAAMSFIDQSLLVAKAQVNTADVISTTGGEAKVSLDLDADATQDEGGAEFTPTPVEARAEEEMSFAPEEFDDAVTQINNAENPEEGARVAVPVGAPEQSAEAEVSQPQEIDDAISDDQLDALIKAARAEMPQEVESVAEFNPADYQEAATTNEVDLESMRGIAPDAAAIVETQKSEKDKLLESLRGLGDAALITALEGSIFDYARNGKKVPPSMIRANAIEAVKKLFGKNRLVADVDAMARLYHDAKSDEKPKILELMKQVIMEQNDIPQEELNKLLDENGRIKARQHKQVIKTLQDLYNASEVDAQDADAAMTQATGIIAALETVDVAYLPLDTNYRLQDIINRLMDTLRIAQASFYKKNGGLQEKMGDRSRSRQEMYRDYFHDYALAAVTTNVQILGEKLARAYSNADKTALKEALDASERMQIFLNGNGGPIDIAPGVKTSIGQKDMQKTNRNQLYVSLKAVHDSIESNLGSVAVEQHVSNLKESVKVELDRLFSTTVSAEEVNRSAISSIVRDMNRVQVLEKLSEAKKNLRSNKYQNEEVDPDFLTSSEVDNDDANVTDRSMDDADIFNAMIGEIDSRIDSILDSKMADQLKDKALTDLVKQRNELLDKLDGNEVIKDVKARGETLANPEQQKKDRENLDKILSEIGENSVNVDRIVTKLEKKDPQSRRIFLDKLKDSVNRMAGSKNAEEVAAVHIIGAMYDSHTGESLVDRISVQQAAETIGDAILEATGIQILEQENGEVEFVQGENENKIATDTQKAAIDESLKEISDSVLKGQADGLIDKKNLKELSAEEGQKETTVGRAIFTNSYTHDPKMAPAGSINIAKALQDLPDGVTRLNLKRIMIEHGLALVQKGHTVIFEMPTSKDELDLLQSRIQTMAFKIKLPQAQYEKMRAAGLNPKPSVTVRAQINYAMINYKAENYITANMHQFDARVALKRFNKQKAVFHVAFAGRSPKGVKFVAYDVVDGIPKPIIGRMESTGSVKHTIGLLNTRAQDNKVLDKKRVEEERKIVTKKTRPDDTSYYTAKEVDFDEWIKTLDIYNYERNMVGNGRAKTHDEAVVSVIQRLKNDGESAAAAISYREFMPYIARDYGQFESYRMMWASLKQMQDNFSNEKEAALGEAQRDSSFVAATVNEYITSLVDKLNLKGGDEKKSLHSGDRYKLDLYNRWLGYIYTHVSAYKTVGDMVATINFDDVVETAKLKEKTPEWEAAKTIFNEFNSEVAGYNANPELGFTTPLLQLIGRINKVASKYGTRLSNYASHDAGVLVEGGQVSAGLRAGTENAQLEMYDRYMLQPFGNGFGPAFANNFDPKTATQKKLIHGEMLKSRDVIAQGNETAAFGITSMIDSAAKTASVIMARRNFIFAMASAKMPDGNSILTPVKELSNKSVARKDKRTVQINKYKFVMSAANIPDTSVVNGVIKSSEIARNRESLEGLNYSWGYYDQDNKFVSTTNRNDSKTKFLVVKRPNGHEEKYSAEFTRILTDENGKPFREVNRPADDRVFQVVDGLVYEVTTESYQIHKDMAGIVRQVFDRGSLGKVGTAIVKIGTAIKNFTLLYSMFHAVSLIRSWLFLYKGIGKGLKDGNVNVMDLAMPINAMNKGYLGAQGQAEFVQSQASVIKFLQENGLVFQVYNSHLNEQGAIKRMARIREAERDGKVVKSAAGRVLFAVGQSRRSFNDWVFNKLQTGLKAQSAMLRFNERVEQEMKKGGIPNLKKIAREIAMMENDNYGDVNHDRLMTSQTARGMQRLFLFAPDWSIGNMNAFFRSMNPKRIISKLFLAGGLSETSLTFKSMRRKPGESTAEYENRVKNTISLTKSAQMKRDAMTRKAIAWAVRTDSKKLTQEYKKANVRWFVRSLVLTQLGNLALTGFDIDEYLKKVTRLASSYGLILGAHTLGTSEAYFKLMENLNVSVDATKNIDFQLAGFMLDPLKIINDMPALNMEYGQDRYWNNPQEAIATMFEENLNASGAGALEYFKSKMAFLPEWLIKVFAPEDFKGATLGSYQEIADNSVYGGSPIEFLGVLFDPNVVMADYSFKGGTEGAPSSIFDWMLHATKDTFPTQLKIITSHLFDAYPNTHYGTKMSAVDALSGWSGLAFKTSRGYKNAPVGRGDFLSDLRLALINRLDHEGYYGK